MSEFEQENKTEKTEEEDNALYVRHSFLVDKGQEPLRIDKFLTNRIERISRSKLQAAAKADCIMVNEKPVKSNYKIRPLDEIKVVMPSPTYTYKIEPEYIPLDIVYEDDQLMVIHKQAGLVVHPGIGNFTGTLVHGLMYYWQEKGETIDEGEDATRIGLVHRLDKDTTGLMVIAKSDYAKAFLAKQFYDRTSKRTYNALVWGDVIEDEGTIEGNIGRHPRLGKLMTVFPEGETGKHAISHYKVLERFGYVTLVECKLETGRTHQIRVHFQHIRHTLFGDVKYGGDKILKGTVFTKYKQFVSNCLSMMPRQALHAKTLGFVHPTTKEEMFFDSPLPEDIENVLDKWRRYMGTNSTFNS